MTAPLVFMDTETTGLALTDDIWEFAAVRREPDGTETELHLFIEHNADKCRRLPDEFAQDHAARFPAECSDNVVGRRNASLQIHSFFGDDRPHVVGAVPNFDTERLRRMFESEWPNWPDHEPWHYHLIDVENLAAGYLMNAGGQFTSWHDPSPPWDSEVLSRAVGVDPGWFERHTAQGDVRWAMAIYDKVMGRS